ncbi:MAG: amidophosphoribosyltransferase [Alphaproteobacteria bacterium]|nr:amidophosphoribosyltransferase [Alphaproteobacteria bacterium SS10]
MIANPFDDDKLREECAIFGIYGHDDAAALTALGLHALQHRGQEGTGIVSADGEAFYNHRGLGHVGDHFSKEEVIDNLKGHIAIGHNRYATTGGSSQANNVQPLFAEMEFGGFALGQNGNLTNAITVRQELVRNGSIFQATTDTEVIIHLMARARGGSVVERLVGAMRQLEGAYSLVCMTKDAMYCMRDPMGIRPMVLGRLGDAYVVASETCAFDIIGATFERDIEPGEMVVIDGEGLTSSKPFNQRPSKFCIFEYVYFSRPDSFFGDRSVYEARKHIGHELAKESPVEADLVVPVPDSGVPSAIGYAEEANIPFELGIIRNHYVGRTFIEPTDEIRHLGVKLKHNANRRLLEGKRVVLVDDSIVRGTTSKKIVEMVRAAGAAEVHMRISSPPTTHSCFYGVDTPSQDKLLAANYSVEEMARMINADSLSFVTIDGLYRAVGEAKRMSDQPQFCDACFTGEYPVACTDKDSNAAIGTEPTPMRRQA